jgi:hypothetical protein
MDLLQLGWMRALGIAGSVLTFLALLVGLVMTGVAYFRNKRRVALLGAIGFLILFLFGCCSLGWNIADAPVLKQARGLTFKNYSTARSIVLFLGSLVNLAGLGLIISALWTSSRKE